MQDLKLRVTPRLLKVLPNRRFGWFLTMEDEKSLFSWVCVSWPSVYGHSQLWLPVPPDLEPLVW